HLLKSGVVVQLSEKKFQPNPLSAKSLAMGKEHSQEADSFHRLVVPVKGVLPSFNNRIRNWHRKENFHLATVIINVNRVSFSQVAIGDRETFRVMPDGERQISEISAPRDESAEFLDADFRWQRIRQKCLKCSTKRASDVPVT